MFFEVPPPKKVSALNAIIIDQQILVRDAIKSVLLDVGIRKISQCSNAFEALSVCGSEDFDLVFISFDLSRDKDGFHLLEELKFKGYIKNKTRVIFLSADTDKELVNSVVEMQPDDFWIKPIDINRISKRLNFILKVREILHKPVVFADLKDYSRAVYYSDRLISKTELMEFHPRLYRLKGRCLFALKEYGDAEKFFRELLNKYKFNWVYIGLTDSLLRQAKFSEAQRLIDQIKTQDDTRCAVHDLLAQHYVLKGDFEQAYIEIIQATRLAPRNIARSKRYWDLARLNHDRTGQLRATLNMAKHAKNSIHDSPEFNLNVIRAHVELANGMGENDAAKQLQLAQSKLDELVANPAWYRQLERHCDVVDARIYCARNNKKKAEAILRGLKREDSNDLEFNFDLIKALHETGDREGCMRLLKQSQELADEESFSGNIINKFIEQEMDERSEIHFTPKELIEMATAYHEQKKYNQAMNMLGQALRLSPKNILLAINIVKIASSISEIKDLNSNQKRTTHEAIELLSNTKLTEDDQESFAKYKKLIGNISELDLVSTRLG